MQNPGGRGSVIVRDPPGHTHELPAVSISSKCHAEYRECSAFVCSSSPFNSKLSTFNSLSPKSPHQYHSMELTLLLFSYSYALFCTSQSLKSFSFNNLRTLYPKHPGGGIPSSSFRHSEHREESAFPRLACLVSDAPNFEFPFLSFTSLSTLRGSARSASLRYLFSWGFDDSLLAAHYSLSFPRIMCAPKRGGTHRCTTADLAAPDGTSAKWATACGDSPAGRARKMRSRSRRCSVPSISAATFSTPPGPMATATANSFSEKFCAPTTAAPLADPTKNFTWLQKFRPKTAAGPAAASFLSTIVFRPITSSSTSTKASPTSVSTRSTSFNFTLGRTNGSTTSACLAPSKICAAAAKSAPSASASIAGNRGTLSAPCAPTSSMPCKSFTTSSTRIPRTNSFPRAAKKMSPSSRASPSMKVRSPERSLSKAPGPRPIGAAPI